LPDIEALDHFIISRNRWNDLSSCFQCIYATPNVSIRLQNALEDAGLRSKAKPLASDMTVGSTNLDDDPEAAGYDHGDMSPEFGLSPGEG